MNVADMIEQLEKLDQDAEVIMDTDRGDLVVTEIKPDGSGDFVVLG